MTAAVVDVGCAEWSDEMRSIDRLVSRFQPEVLVGIDPAVADADDTIGSTRVMLRRRVAWVTGGNLLIRFDGASTHITDIADDAEPVAAVDIAGVVAALQGPVVVKMDCEGSEYALLERLHQTGIDEQLQMLLVEWHEFENGSHLARRDAIEASIRCPIEEWIW